ncbi:3-dehydroquinate synthase [Candidatus Riflebacteria bacterium]
MHESLRVNLGNGYSIWTGTGFLEESCIVDFCKKQANFFVIITDSNLVALYGNTLQKRFKKSELLCHLLSFSGGDANKTRKTKQMLEDRMFSLKCGRDTCIIALGGGVVSDLAGFIASTYCRGVPAVYVPTTLLAMVDASIGGKTGINTVFGKNLVGTFYQPAAVFMDLISLKTLPKREFKNGMVEMIKHGLIADAKVFMQLKKNLKKMKKSDSTFAEEMIIRSCEIKKEIVERDEKEKGERSLLNFGHTIGHAIESVEEYKITHGEAVAIGILVESFISYKLGILQEKTIKEIRDIFDIYEIPLVLNQPFNMEKLKKSLKLDKKAIKNSARFVLLEDIGKPHYSNTGYTSEVPDEILNESILWMQENF